MATKTFPNAVIWGGKLIPANTPIEVKEDKATISEKETVETPKKPTKKGGVKNDEGTV